MTSGPPPEEPTLRSSPCLLSPTSPKPIHLPTPTNIPILEMQNDVEFNQTELHMNDPAMHNTELRPGAWKDPAEQLAEQASAQPSVQGDGGDGPSSQEKVAAARTTTTTYSHEGNAGNDERSAEPQQSASADQSDFSMPSNGDSHPDLQAAAKPDEFSSQADVVKFEGDAPTIPGSVDVQSLLTSLQTAPGAVNLGAVTNQPVTDAASYAAPDSPSVHGQQQVQPNVASPLSASGPGVPAGLPPRPPPQEQPLIHPNYVHSQHIRDYHPHAANPAFQPHGRSNSSGNATDTSSRPYVPPVHSPTNPSVSGDARNASYQQTPVSATAPFQSPVVSTPQSASIDSQSRRENYLLSGEPKKSEDAPWTPETQRKYDQFIETERNYVQQGRWEQFPNGSRLFVGTRDLNGRKTTYEEDRLNALAGNLSSEKVTKRDIFHVFHPYGDLAQISIKQAYGFVQFFSAEDCARALAAEQGRQIRDKRIHLEVSKPQKNRPGVSNRRSRSPDYGRATSQGDRFRPGSRNGHRDSRDSYRGYRSPSPRGYGRDRFDGRYRQRSPPSYGRYRRSPSPRREREPDDDLPLPKRAPQDVPDLQIIVIDNLDRDFISWVENAFTSRGVRVDVLLLSPRLSEQGVVRRQILEGVLAVCKLTRHNQSTAKIGLQVFDRRAGPSNVKFEEYDGLEPLVASELVLRAKQSNTTPVYGSYPPAPPKAYGYDRPHPPQSSYPYPQYQQPLQQPLPLPTGAAPPGPPPNLQNIITSLDPASLQNILSAVGQGQTPVTPQHGSAASYGVMPQQPQLPPYGQQQNDALAALRSNPALAGALQQQYSLAPPPAQQHQAAQTSPTTGGQVNMQDILARLGNPGR